MNAFLRLFLLGLFVAPLAAEEKPAPRLAVVISVDQMRADYLARFAPYFGEGGFKRLLAGADYRNCHYRHAITITAPGHATILSGVNANVHGIVANAWLDRATYLSGNAVEDRDAALVGLPPEAGRYPNATLEAKSGRSPRNFLGTTVGDRLKAHHDARSKVFGVADKDRAAILLAGVKADGAYWTEEGFAVTSAFYRPALPDWVAVFNAEGRTAKQFGREWTRLTDASIYDAVQGADDAVGEANGFGLTRTFPKHIDGGRSRISRDYFEAFDHTPWNNDLVADFARELIVREKLGEDDGAPDLLAIGFSQPDRAGHAWGPDSHEVMDTYLRLDRTLAQFFAFLEARIGLTNCLIVLTADHGVSPLPEKIQAEQGAGAAGRIDPKTFDDLVVTALQTAFGTLPEPLFWVVRDGAGYHLNPAALQAANVPAERVAVEVRNALLSHPAVATAYTRAQLTGPQPLDALGEMLRLSYHQARSPDVMIIPKPYFLPGRSGTVHGTPYDYDTHVPQLWLGAGVPAGVHPERVAVEDLAPTLAGLLGVELPPEAKGKRLF